jgi:peptide/nickel transport system substrate-binding protein
MAMPKNEENPLMKHRLFLFGAVLLLILAACAPAIPEAGGSGEQPAESSGEPQQGGWIMLATIEDPDTLDPHKTIMATASGIQSWIYETLFYIGEDKLPHGLLAESWEVSEDSKTMTIKLREGRTFHDGTPVNAQAVEFTFTRMFDPAIASPAKDQAGPISTVRAVDEYTVEIVFEEPYAPFFYAASLSYLGILPPGAVQERGDDFGRNPVGSGPFMFESWSPGQEIRLVRNPNYVNVREDRNNRGAPYIDGIIFKNIPEEGTRIAAMETGEINVLTLSRESAPRFLDDPEFKIIDAKESPSFNFVEFNYKRPPFDNPEFRRAMGMSIDAESILEGAYNGYATLNSNPYPVGNPGYDPAIGEEFGMKYDPEAAMALFEELGWRDEDGDGVREAYGVEGLEEGKVGEFTCWTYPAPIKQRECEIIQANMADVGFKINIQLTDFGTMSAEMPNGQFDFDVMRWTWNEPVILSLLFKCPGWKELFCDEELDEILTAADTEMDPVARIELVKQAQQYILEQAIVIPLASDWWQTASHNTVNDVRYDATFNLTLDDAWISQ